MRTIKSRGKLNIINNIPQGKGSFKTADFLEKLVNGFIKYSGNYMEIVNESPFAYRERQLNSLFGPAMADFTDAFLTEIPAIRKNKAAKTESYGWVDFWARYRKVDFYLELKHSYGSYNSGVITKETMDLWAKAKDQTQNCSKSLLRMEDSDGIMVLPVQVIPIYEGIYFENEPSSIENTERLLEIQNFYHDELVTSANWSALWIIHKDLAYDSYHVNGDKRVYYSAVLIVSNVTDIQ